MTPGGLIIAAVTPGGVIAIACWVLFVAGLIWLAVHPAPDYEIRLRVGLDEPDSDEPHRGHGR